MRPWKSFGAMLMTAYFATTTVWASGRGAIGQIGIAGQGRSPFSHTPRPTSGNTTSYFNLPLHQLQQAVPVLKGLQYEESQDRLPALLAGIAETIGNVLPRLPDLVSREDVNGFQAPREIRAGSGTASAQPWSREFRYLILCHHSADGNTSIQEVRTDSRGRAAEASDAFASPRGYGFAYQWLFFSAGNQSEFRFRYLGQQEKEGRKTLVIVFAQDPGKVSNPPLFQAAGKTSPFYYQGVLWVDQSTLDIVMLRTDLLAELPEERLTMLTTELKFHLVPIHGFNAAFWLPSEVDITSDQGFGVIEEVHRYSDYHLYHASSKILPPAD